jgi:hypothetical protein
MKDNFPFPTHLELLQAESEWSVGKGRTVILYSSQQIYNRKGVSNSRLRMNKALFSHTKNSVSHSPNVRVYYENRMVEPMCSVESRLALECVGSISPN